MTATIFFGGLAMFILGICFSSWMASPINPYINEEEWLPEETPPVCPNCRWPTAKGPHR